MMILTDKQKLLRIRNSKKEKRASGQLAFLCVVYVCRNTPNEYKIKQYTDVSYFQHTTGLLISELSLFSKISRVVLALHRRYV